MNLKQAEKEIKKLRDEINHYDHLYYALDKPSISDAGYDQLFLKLKNLEEQYPRLITDDSPTQRVGGQALEQFQKFKHRVPLLSLESIFTRQDLEKFDERIVKDTDSQKHLYIVEPKFDGLSVELVYQKGVFKGAGTRGDGQVGEDVTLNVKTIKTLPLKLKNISSVPDELHLRAEVIMPLKGFDKLNKTLIENGDEPFANPRNAASGAIRQLDSKITAMRPLDIYVYDFLYATDFSLASHWDILNQFQKWGLPISPLKQKCTSIDDIMAFHARLDKERDALDYEIDGIVGKLNDKDLQNSLGARARTPRWAFALKFEPRREITHINDIVVQVGRQGTLTPVAQLQPVDVGGVTVSRASLHNIDIINKLDVRVGDTVKVVRAGDVIPEVKEVVPAKRGAQSKPFQMPQKCPVCSSSVTIEGAFYFCSGGYTCSAQLKWSIIHFASKRAMDIETLGHQTIDLFVEKGLLSHAADLYALKAKDLDGLEGFKDKKIANIIEGIALSKTKSLDRFLFALGIRHVGEEVARLIVMHFQSLDSIMAASVDDIQAIKGVGPQIAQSVFNFFSEKRNQKLVAQFKKHGLQLLYEKPKQDNLYAGKSFVLTGELESLTRDQAKKSIIAKGGKVTSSVSKKTSYVIAGANPGSKFDKAQKLGIPILNEEEFLNLT